MITFAVGISQDWLLYLLPLIKCDIAYRYDRSVLISGLDFSDSEHEDLRGVFVT